MMDIKQLTDADVATPGLDDLEADDCWELLRTQPVGRVAVNLGAYPLVVPVNFAVDGTSVVFRTGSGSKLDRIHGSKVSFEVDQIDPVHHTGWSVMIKGVAQGMNVRGNQDLAHRSQAAGAEPWATGERPYLVRIRPDAITGRRISSPERPPSDLQNYG